MRPAPGPIPDRMPAIDDAVRNIVQLIDMPRNQLQGYSLSQLVNEYSDGSAKWLTGSTVWLPAVFGEVDKSTDFDLVFQNKDGWQRFCEGVEASLSNVTRHNMGNGVRYSLPDGDHIIDAWYLIDDETIGELLLTFPYAYQRCAYYLTWSGASPAYLTRIIKVRTRFERREGGYGR